MVDVLTLHWSWSFTVFPKTLDWLKNLFSLFLCNHYGIIMRRLRCSIIICWKHSCWQQCYTLTEPSDWLLLTVDLDPAPRWQTNLDVLFRITICTILLYCYLLSFWPFCLKSALPVCLTFLHTHSIIHRTMFLKIYIYFILLYWLYIRLELSLCVCFLHNLTCLKFEALRSLRNSLRLVLRNQD